MSARVVLQVNAVVGLASVAVSAALMWLLLTRPMELASAVGDDDLGALVAAVGHQLGAWLHALLRFL